MTARLWNHDRQVLRNGVGLVGVDEAGRGCLAGPVFAGAVYLPEALFGKTWKRLNCPKIDDSKKLSKPERDEALDYLYRLRDEGSLRVGLGTANVKEINTHNILGATTLAMQRAIEGLDLPLPMAKMPLWASKDSEPTPPVLIDGRPVKRLPFSHEGIVQGDGKSLAIALASVVAKVERDRFMLSAHEKYPEYGWDRNCGYGTEIHRRAILESGPSPLHRPLFLRKILNPGRESLSS